MPDTLDELHPPAPACLPNAVRRRMLRAGAAVGVLVLVACQQVGVEPAPRSVACFQGPPPTSPEVARVGSASVTMQEMTERIREQGARAARVASDPQWLRRLVEDQVRLRLLARAAVDRGLHQDPDVIQAARKVMVRKLLQHDLGPQVFAELTSERAVRAYYERRKDEYRKPETRRIMHIQLSPTPEGKALAEQLLMELADKLDDRAAFKKQARRHSEDHTSRKRGGELPFLSKQELTQRFGMSFAERVFEMEPQSLADAPLQSIRGWHVVLLLAVHAAKARDFEDVRDEIRERLLQGRRTAMFDQYLNELQKRHPVAIYEDRLPELMAYVRARLAK